MKSKPFRRTTGTLRLIAATGCLSLTTISAFAEIININNAGFEDAADSAGRGNWATVTDWTEENAGSVFVDDNGTSWVPEPSRTLYFGPGAVHQDLGHNWSSSDTFTVGIIAMNPTWSDNNNTFKVQLRQASDDTVLWDSGDQNVGGTVTAGPAYAGTGHIFSWNIDASTFTAGTAGEQLNIRIAHVSGGPVYADNVSLDVTGPDLIAPTLASTIPEDDADTVYPSPNLVATFSEDIALTGNGTVTIRNLDDGSGLSDIPINLPDAAQVSASGTDLTINPTADLNLDTNYAIQISADAVVDLAANPFAGILDDTTWNFQTIAETTPPTLASTSPVDGAPAVATNSNLVATFDEPVTAGAGNITIKNLTEATDTVLPVGDAQVSVSGTDLTIDLSTDLDPGDDYAIQIDAGAITDTVGNPYAGILAPDVTTWNFTTAADTIDPSIASLSPADDATGVLESAKLVATFSEAIMAAAPTVLFSEDFESNDGGFTVATSGTAWAHGDPDSSGPGGTVSSGNPGSPLGCWGTNLGDLAGSGDEGFYANPTESCLRSAVIDLTGVASASLSFAQALDLEAGDTAVVNVIDDITDDVIATAIYTATDSNISSADWEAVGPVALPVGEPVRIEWCLSGQAASEDYMGWYVDDVQVSAAGSITLKNLSEATETVIPVTDPQVSISGDTLTIDPATDLDFEDDYAVQIGANAVTDLSGNPFAGIGDDVTWNFTVRVVPTAITINNFGFEDASGNAGRGNLADVADWTEENAGSVFVDDNGTSWVPEPSRTLYFGPGAVHQDLNHNWSSSNVFTLGLIAMNPTWSDNNNTFKVQLRQASDDTVLWDSGDQNVGGTVTAGPSYTGTGHVFSWSIDASTFTAGTAGEQINIRIAHVSGGPVYLDKVSLDVIGGGGGGGNDFSDWIAGYSVGGQTGIGDDPDGDGVDSGVENFFGTAPDEFSAGLVSGTVSGNTFTFTHPQGTLADDLTAAYRWTKNLVDFYGNLDMDGDGTTVEFSATTDAGITTVTATVTGTATTKLFVDVEVTQP